MAWDPGTLLAASESESESSESSPRSSSGMPSAASAWSLLGRNRKRCNRPAHPSSSHISSSHPSLLSPRSLSPHHLSLSLSLCSRLGAAPLQGPPGERFVPRLLGLREAPRHHQPGPPAGSVAASLCRSLSAASAALGTPGRHPLPTPGDAVTPPHG